MTRQIMEMKEVGRKINDYENRMDVLTQERERLEGLLKGKTGELMESERKINNL